MMSRNDEHVGDLLVDSIEEIPEEYKINSRDLREVPSVRIQQFV